MRRPAPDSRSPGGSWRTGPGPCAGPGCPARGAAARQLVVLPVAHRAEQHGVGRLRELERRLGQRMAMRLVAGAADRRFFQLERQSAPALQDLDRLRDDLGDRCRHPAGWRSSCSISISREGRAGELQVASAAIALRFERLDLVRVRSVRPMSSKPFSRQCLRNGSTSNVELFAAGLVTIWLLQIDRQLVAVRRRHLVEQRGRPSFGQHDRQQAVLEAVVEEDVGEARRDDRAESRTAERPGRVLARGAAAEVLAREQDRGAPVARLVQHEVRVGGAEAESMPGSPWSR